MINFNNMLGNREVAPNEIAFIQRVRDCYEGGQFKHAVVSRDGDVDLVFGGCGPDRIDMVVKGLSLLELDNIVRQLTHSARQVWPDDELWKVKR